MPSGRAHRLTLKEKAAEIGAALPEYLDGIAAQIQTTLDQDMASGATTGSKRPASFNPFDESLGITLHLLDRAAFQMLGPARRGQFMDSLLPALAASLSTRGIPESRVRSSYNFAQQTFSHYEEVVASPDENLKGTLSWEFGKRLGLIVGATNPVTLMRLAIGAGLNYAALVGILQDFEVRRADE